MGAWSEHTFGNDAACDWGGDFLEHPSLEKLGKEIDTFLLKNGHLDSHYSCLCLSACEVIARLRGNWGERDAYSEELDNWIEENPIEVPNEILRKSREAIGRILSESSELKALWESDSVWLESVGDLLNRLI